jgi:hypothetical protein
VKDGWDDILLFPLDNRHRPCNLVEVDAAVTRTSETGSVRDYARGFGKPAITALAELAGLNGTPGAANEATRVVALRELLDRGFGRPVQPLAGEPAAPLLVDFRWADQVPSVTTTTAVIEAAVEAGADDELVGDDSAEIVEVRWAARRQTDGEARHSTRRG